MGWGFYWEDGELEKNMACHDGFVRLGMGY